MPNILIVDDDEDILCAYEVALKSAGHKVTSAFSGEAAAKIISEKTFDAILVDMMMPGMSGIDLTGVIKSNILNYQTPVFMISGNINSKNIQKLKSLGLVEIIEKPPVLRDLLAQIEEVLKPKWHVVAYEPKVVSIFDKACRDVFASHIKDTMSWQSPSLCKTGHAPHEYSATVALFGQIIYGSVSLCCNEATVEHLAMELFGDKSHIHSKEFLGSILGEMCNQLAGELRRAFSAHNVDVLIGLPEVNVSQVRLPHKVSNPAVTIECSGAGDEELVTSMCLGNPRNLKFSPGATDFEVFLYE